ncbi:hypothetical protein ACOSQ2_027931 [Xanthoceras sorbifolium]
MAAMSLVGKIFANRVINMEAFQSAIPRIWRTTRDVEIESVGMNVFIFHFGCEWDRKRVLEGGPWCFDKFLIVLREVQGVGRISVLDFNFVPLWVQLYNLPIVGISKEMGIFLGGLIGKVVDIDVGSNGSCIGRFIRVRVLVEVSKALKRGLRVSLGDQEKCVRFCCAMNGSSIFVIIAGGWVIW